MIQSFSRRTLLRGLGVSLALPPLESFAQVGDPVRRTVAINIPLGFLSDQFFPKAAGEDYEPSPYLALAGSMRNRMTVFSGLSHPGVDGGHAAEKSFLTAAVHPASRGFRNSISLDQVMAGVVGNETRHAALTLGDISLSWSANGVPIPTEKSPARAFSKLFLKGSERELSDRKQKLNDGHSILDSVLDDAASLERKVSRRDREKLDEFFTAVRETEDRLIKADAWLDRPLPVVEEKPPAEVGSGDVAKWLRAHYATIRLALETDSSRVIAFSGANHSLVPPLPGVSMGYHGLSHHGKNPDMMRQLEVIDRETILAWVEFLEALDATVDGGGTLLDHTQVLMGSNLGNASAHFTNNLPIVLAGGSYDHGRYLAFDETNNEPLCNLYVSMLQWMGVETDRFGSSSGTQKGLDFS